MKIESPEDRALLMFCKITRGQWFNDGNKRTALMTANHALINAGITSVESRRLELKRSGTAAVDQNLPVYQTAMSMRAQTPAY